jgi:class 3 adenylate cyclase
MKDQQNNNKDDTNMSNNKRLKSWLVDGGVQKGDASEQPIADLFPKATVLFTDIAGFTAWSSSREPTQVFTLLQNIYRNFDEIADRRRVFKVETIGDSYMAVTGLPEPQEQHALIMARFALEIRQKMNEATHELATILGPGTSGTFPVL